MSRFVSALMLLFTVLALAVMEPANALQTPSPAVNASAAPSTAHIQELISKLNAPDVVEREEAETELLSAGEAALEPLRDASGNSQPEIAARAKKLLSKMVHAEGKPLASYAELFPAASVFFAESPDSKAALNKLNTAPLGRLWNLPETQKFYKGHYDAQIDNDRKLLDCVMSLFKLTDGRALMAIGAPETAEATELDPPMVYMLESKQSHELELQVRALMQAMNDPPRSIRHYGPFQIEEQMTAQTVFNQDGMTHALTQAAMEAYLDKFTKKPDEPLTRELAELRKQMPSYDLLIQVKNSGLNLLADANQLVDEDIIRALNTVGFVEGASFKTALNVNPDGFEERGHIALPAKIKNDGLLAIVKSMDVAVPAAAPAPADAPPAPAPDLALNLIPWQAGMLISFNGDIAKNSAALSRALRALDAAHAPETPEVSPKPPDARAASDKIAQKLNGGAKPDAGNRATTEPAQPAPVPAPAPVPPADQTPAEPPKTLGQKAVAAAGGLGEVKKPDEAAPPADPKPDEAKPAYKHIERFERIGIKLEQFLEQVDGPGQLALFLNTIGDDIPETLPITPLYAFVLKDPRIVEQALDAQSTGNKPRFAKELLNGGFHYVEVDGGEARPGYWLKGNYFAYSSERDVLDLASKALMHEAGNERMADRPSYKQELASKRNDPQALLTIFGDADQVLEMPYKLAALAWKPEATNPYPDYSVVKSLLLNKPISIQFKAAKDAIVFSAQTPLSLIGIIQAFRLPLKEAGL